MPTYKTKDGRTLTWEGKGICVCTHCDEIFNSLAAFDHHLRVRGDKPAHYHEDMPRNAKGYKVTALWGGER